MPAGVGTSGRGPRGTSRSHSHPGKAVSPGVRPPTSAPSSRKPGRSMATETRLPGARLATNRPHALTLRHAKRGSTAGTDHDHIRVFVAPNESLGRVHPVDGESDVIVNAGEPVRSPVNVWVHEYRHTRRRSRRHRR